MDTESRTTNRPQLDLSSAIKTNLFIFGSIFLCIEAYYITAFINTYPMVSGLDLLKEHSQSGRLLSSIGLSYSVFVSVYFLTRNSLERPVKKAFFVSVIAGCSIYYGIEKLVDQFVDNAKQETILCSFLGNYAKKNFLIGEGTAVPFWNSESTFTPFEDIQLGLILLPAAMCTNKQILDESFSTRKLRVDFKAMIEKVVDEKNASYHQLTIAELSSKIRSLKANLKDIREGHLKVVSASTEGRYQRYLKNYRRSLSRGGISHSSVNALTDFTDAVRSGKRRTPSENAFYETIIRAEFTKKQNDILKGAINTKRDIISEISRAMDKEKSKLVTSVVTAWSKGLPAEGINTTRVMREAVKTVVSPLILISCSGLSILLAFASLMSLLIPDLKNSNVEKNQGHGIRALFKMTKFLLSPIVIIPAIIVFIPVSQTQSFMLKDIKESNEEIAINSLLKTQFFVYPKLMNIYQFFHYRPTLNMSGHILAKEEELITYFSTRIDKSFNEMKYTTPSLQSVVFSSIALDSYRRLEEKHIIYLRSIIDFYTKNCSKADFDKKNISCVKMEYMNSLSLIY
ncbi:hypothetical protein [Marinomonas sp. IMCC 4694]|uniref:hypothetical protein n=1 Tax=Marinomonas sp. IMCC 4694 TaxID=2605432 RepID=UPI0011E65ED5|nr:hypothetical protein [Marinomonas sp. IMCC 4694]TYL46558.1 hypothetical protein FXV75_00555 [Marinomonas sp. IMCC 4694]